MKTHLSLACSIALLVGCSTPVYRAQDPAQFKRDSWECSRDSTTFGGGSGLVGVMFILAARSQSQKLYNQCMESKGYVRAE